MRFRSLATLALILVAIVPLAGCSANQLAQAQADLDTSQKTYNATTQATADKKAELAKLPLNSPGVAQAQAAVTVAEKSEAIAGKALDVATSTLTALQTGNLTDPKLAQSVNAALGAIPGPYTPLIQVVGALALGGLTFGVTHYKLGVAHGQIAAGNTAAAGGLQTIAPATPSPPPTSSTAAS